MLEGLVANLLNRFLGMYVRNFDPKQLNVGIWSGDVKLRNLELRREALDQLKLPINVVEGHVGLLTLSIPWSNLRGKPVRVNIEDVFLLAAPKEDQEYDPEEEEKRAHSLKMEKLDSAELLKERNTEGMSQEEQAKNQTFTASLTTAIVDNIQISVKNVHVRYEDSISDPGHPFAVGITLQELSAVSTDENWKPTFVQSTSGTTHKLATLGALALYWDTDTELLGTGKGSQSAEEQGLDHEKTLERLKEMIAKKDAKEFKDHQYILKPVTGRAGLEMDKTGRTDRPKVKARLLFNELGFILDDNQYRDALRVVDLFHYFTRHQEYRKLQPKAAPKEDPRAWLRFAGQAVLDKIHDRNKQWSWAYLKERRDDRIRYIELFKKKKKEEKLTPDEAKDMDRLERKLSYEDLRFWRSLGRNQLRKENVGVKKQPQKQTWSQWVWGSGKPQEEHSDETQMTEEQRKELYSAIDFDEKKQLAEAVDMPKEAIKLQVDMSLREGSFTLKRDPHGRDNEMLKLIFQGLDTKFLQRTDSTLLELSLDTMSLMDGTTEGNLFEQALRVKASKTEPDSGRVEDVTEEEDAKAAADASKREKDKLKDGDEKADEGEKDDDEDEDEASEEPFFALSFENNPLSGKADTALSMKLKAMEFVYNPRFVVEVAKFFKPPERHMESIGALMETAGSAVEGLRQQTRAGLEYALQEHKTIDAKLDLQAPLIIVPDSVTKQSSICMILDAGHIAVRSELIDKDTLANIQSKQKQQYTEADFRELEGLMYDKFIVSLDSTQVLIGNSIDDTRQQLDEQDPKKSYHVVERINMEFKVEICIVPKATDLTKFRIAGHLPVLHASVSDSKYKSLMKLLDVAIPKFESDEPAPKTPTKTNGSTAEKRKSSNLSPSAMKKDRSSSFQFSAQKHELVMEDDSDHDEEGQQNKYRKASQGDKDKETNLNQRNFEFKFTVDKLRGSLFRSDPEGKKPDQLLVDLIAEHFYLEFYQRPFDMVAEVKLRKLAVEDHVEENPDPQFKNLISSEDVFTNKQEDLFALKFIKVNKEHPKFMSEYEGFAMNLDVAVSTINLLVTRKTLLTLLDFVLATFTNQNPPEQQRQVQSKEDDTEKEEAVAPQQAQEPDKIRVKARLKRIAVILNNDGMKLATLSLNSAEVVVLLLGKTMRVGARLGNLTLIDDINQGIAESSPLRQLVSIEGKELADFSYETFDPEAESYPGHDTAIKLQSGSIKINFLTEPFRKIMQFGVKFGKMQAIFNAARQAAANQAQNIQQRASKMHFDINIKTPIVAFPKVVISNETPERDTVTAYLGTIYAKNEFVPLDDSKDAAVANKLSAGIQNIRLTSNLHYEDDKSEELEMIDKVDLDFKINSAEHRPGAKRPDTEIEGSMSNINLKITQAQLKFIMELSKSIPEAFAADPDEDIEEDVQDELPDSTTEPAKQVMASPTGEQPKTGASHLGPELGEPEEAWTKLDLVFKVGTVGLELITGSADKPVGDLADASLSKFSLNETSVKLRMVSDGAMESELLVQSFTITDTRTKEKNKFRKVMSLINTDVKQQFMASVSISGGEDRNLVALLTIDSPRIILALDHLFALQRFVSEGLAQDEPLQVEDEDEQSTAGETDDDMSVADQSMIMEQREAATKSDEKQGGMSIAYRVNLVDAQIVLIANPSITSSEAIVLGVKQVLVSQQHAMTLQVDKIGMFLCRMDKFETTQLRILDDFSVQTSLDMGSKNKDTSMMSIEVDIEPLVLRLSLRDILLAMQIFQRASAISGSGDDQKMAEEGPTKLKQVKAASQKGTSTKKPKSSHKPTAKTISTTKKSSTPSKANDVTADGSAVLKREEMKVNFDGMRVVLIGDTHELPILDWSVKKFGVEVRDWSGAMTADTQIDTFFNVFNFSKSAWEPLIEPWQLGFHMAKSQHPDKLAVDLYSRKSMEITLTSASIALFSKSAQFLSADEDVLSKPRGMDAPFRVRNYTGFDLNIWANSEKGEEGTAAKLTDGEEIPWRFEDPTTTRETLSPAGATGLVGIRLEESGFDSIDRIPVNREGESLYNLRPRRDKVQHRLLVEVSLGADNVKNIIFRSPLLVENNTQVPIEIGVFDSAEGHLSKIDKIAPGDSRPAPVGAAYMHSLVVRPDPGFGYAWSSEQIFWRDLLKRPTKAITCKSESQDSSPPFYFQMQSVFDKKDPLTAVYPYQRIKLSAPIEIQNLLPYDFKYRVYDKNTKKDWTNFLRKGGVSPVHVVELSHLLLMSVDMQDTPFKASEFAIINSSNREDFSREKSLTVKDNNDLSLRLKLHYYNVPDSGGAFKITVHSPYVVLNRTGLELDVRSKAFFGATKSAAGQNTFNNADNDTHKATPFMFSFPTDDQKNRALLKITGSQWSKPVSFDAIGSTTDVAFPAESGRSEMHCGLTVEEGDGKYKLTKVITLAPRFVVKNKLGEELNIREPGSSEVTTLKSGDLHPLRYLKQTTGQQLCLCFPGVNNTWSSPFNIANVGSVHVKLAKAGERQRLVRVEILMENATIFLHVSFESKHWPYSMRNESDTEFLFWQANPNVDEDEEDRSSGWKPIRYRLPPRSIMPYAWDYPAAKSKNLVLSAHKKERHVKLQEIGNLIPLKLPPQAGAPRQKVIDLNVMAEGPTQTLVLSNWNPKASLYKQKSASASASTSTGFEVKEQDSDVTLKAEIRFAGIGLSLVNKQMKELIYLTLRDIDITYKDSKLYQMLSTEIKWIQIDNQLYGGIFPLIFYPSVVPKTGKEMAAHPIFKAAVTRVKDDSYGVLYIKYFTFLMQQMTIEIDEDFIFALLDFSKVPGASWTEEKEGKLCEEDLDIPEPKQEQSSQDIYFELLHLQPMQFDLSFVRTERINAEDTGSSSSNPFMFAVNVLTMSIGNVNDAPIKYNALMLENARVSMGALISAVRSHYVQESLRQVHIVLGSADFLGNPVGLFNNISSGVADIFYEPYQGLVMTDRPQDLGIGIAKGASSFVKKSVFGFSDSMAKFTGSISKGLAAASLDKEFQDQRRMSRSRNRPKHALYGITSGGNAFATSVASGIGGLARHPMEGAEKEGALGFVKGVGKGVLGFATKPAIGAFDLASNLAEGVRNTTTVFDQEGLDRVRMPRFIGQDGIVRPYGQREALGQFWLKTLDNGKYFHEEYIAHLELASGTSQASSRQGQGQGQDGGSPPRLVMLTYNGILLVQTKKLQTEWDVPLKDIQTISKERTGMSIVLKGGTNGPFMPIADEQSRNWFYRQVAVAVNAYNDKWNAKG
ncbi:Vacuolar protein sorting-associated protein 13 [Elsinoe australis]|uniref:Vacuolar protein sorting-associated protein 13 n=1 Tax=Elsinoe australis TaxID=40998 RepID=A0A2P7YIT4_9PEZI|nr:Vacuolar protein sorting-associated protein 13 [Elsinoe australis]